MQLLGKLSELLIVQSRTLMRVVHHFCKQSCWGLNASPLILSICDWRSLNRPSREFHHARGEIRAYAQHLLAGLDSIGPPFYFFHLFVSDKASYWLGCSFL